MLVGTSATASARVGLRRSIASQTSDPFLVAMGGLLQRLPWLLFGLYAGVLADRIDRRLLVVDGGLVRAVLTPTP